MGLPTAAADPMNPSTTAAVPAGAASPVQDAMIRPELPAPPPGPRAAITAGWVRDEAAHVRHLLELARLPDADRIAAQATAADLVRRVRARAQDQGAIEAFMRQYDLGSEEGVLLMCVAEALLRIPDQDTADKLIRDKLGDADWKKHMGQSDSVLVNASTWGLMLTGHLVDLADETKRDVHGAFKRLLGRVGEPVIRLAVRQAMKIMGHQFVMGRTIGEALARSLKGDNANYRYSFDMLGEGALTTKDALRYLQAYRDAIHAIGKSGNYKDREVFGVPSISVKLSALHPRYEHAKRERVFKELNPRVLELAQLAKSYGIGFTIDAEEADRLELSLDVIAAGYADESLAGWEGYGLAIQAYQKRAPQVIDFIADLARKHGRRIPVRLVKGAYWDSEVKRAQVDHRRLLPRQRAQDAGSDGRDLSDVRHPQRADDRHDPPARQGDGPRESLRVPEAARHGRRPLRRGHSRRSPRRALPRVRAGGLARGPAAVPGAPPARERRQFQLRQPHHRRGHRHR